MKIRPGPPVPAPEFKEKRKPPVGNLVVFLIIIVLAALAFLQKKAIDRESQLLQAVQEEKSKLQYVMAKLDELRLKKETIEKKISLITLLKARQGMAVTVMDELSRALPEWVWLNEASFENNQIRLKGNALSNNLIADYILNLENSPHFENVNLISSAQRAGGASSYQEFSMTLDFVLPESLKPLPETKAKPTPKKRTQR